jgi:excisionase family DNA binding protein
MERVLLTVAEVAEALHVGRSKVFELVISGEIESVKIGKLRRVSVAAVHAYAERLAAEAEAS